MPRIVIIFLATFSALLLPGAASAELSRTGTPSVVFTAAGPGGLKIDGKTNELNVAESGDALNVTVPLAGLDTGISLRNKHMREKYLETDKFPNATLVVLRSDLRKPSDGADVNTSASAQITIHGKTRTVTMRYQAHRAGATYDVQGTTRVNMNDFGINVPSYLGVTVKPDVDIAVRFSLLDA